MGHDTCGDHGGTNRDGDPCGQPAGYGTDFEDGKCKHHRGTNADGSSHEGNDYAVTVGAWADDFFEGFLTEAEQKRVREMAGALDDEKTAQELGQHVATLALEQFRRTGDERFLRRFESICDKFSIAPADEVDLTVDGEITHDTPAEFVDYESDTDE